MSRGVEVAGFPFGPQPIWSRLHTVELASYRLRKDSMRFPPLAVIESFPHGLSKSTDSNVSVKAETSVHCSFELVV